MSRRLFLAAAIVLGGVSFSAEAHQTETYFYDVHGRLAATTKAPPNGGYRTRYELDVANNRDGRMAEQAGARTAGDQLLPGQDLLPGQRLVSADGRLFFLLQAGDSNAVIYGPPGALWSTNTANGRGTVLSLQTDGNLVMRGPQNELTWQSGTGGHPGARLVMQNDGNLVIYSGWTAVWHTGTCCY
ncbi:hypothetical protein [Brevundimonas sp.]|uniref:hypothetical protein n=1 Tax=Brevundimonas sp. TaxID=1871086 RepID=UPI003D0DE938